jgi:hypothetical protein
MNYELKSSLTSEYADAWDTISQGSLLKNKELVDMSAYLGKLTNTFNQGLIWSSY